MAYPDETGRSTGTTTGGTTFTEVNINPASAGPSKVFIPAGTADGQAITLVLFAHGAGGDETQVSAGGPLATRDGIINKGWVLASSLGGGTAAWGNDAALDSYVAVIDWARARWSVQHVILWGASMGGLTAALLAVSGRVSDVRCLVSIDGALSLRAFYDFTPHQINTAYDVYTPEGRTYALQTAGHDPCLRPSSDYANLPIFLSASTGDTMTPKVDHSDPFFALVDPVTDVTYLTGSSGHFSAANFMPTEALAFMTASLSTSPVDPPTYGTGLRRPSGTLATLRTVAGATVKLGA